MFYFICVLMFLLLVLVDALSKIKTTIIMHNVMIPAIMEDVFIIGNCSNFNI